MTNITTPPLKPYSVAVLPTQFGEFLLFVFCENDKEHAVLAKGFDRQGKRLKDGTPLVRMHSECLTGDAFFSQKCDCGAQLQSAMAQIDTHGLGLILYLRQEGRGIGLGNKIRAYALQEQGHDTLAANLLLGLPADARDYSVGVQILHFFALNNFALLTNNPDKIAHLQAQGFGVERAPLVVGQNAHNQHYLFTKRDKMGHLL